MLFVSALIDIDIRRENDLHGGGGMFILLYSYYSYSLIVQCTNSQSVMGDSDPI